jgi:hypothetical protein
MTNLIADPTFATHATITSDGTVVDNGDGTFRIDFGGYSAAVLLDLTAPFDPSHRYEVTFHAEGNPHNLHPTLNQQGFAQASIGSPPNLWGTGDYDHTFTITTAPVGQLRISANAPGPAFSLSNVSVIDLDG